MIDQQLLPTSLPFEESDTEETRLFTEFYLKYRRERSRIKTETKIADYDWTGLPDTFPIEVWIYKSLLLEFTSGISNTLNDLRRHIIALQAWDAVFDGLDDKTKQRLLIEFINPVATNVINLPHVIKARFGYAVAHLSFHANRARDDVVWKDGHLRQPRFLLILMPWLALKARRCRRRGRIVPLLGGGAPVFGRFWHYAGRLRPSSQHHRFML